MPRYFLEIWLRTVRSIQKLDALTHFFSVQTLACAPTYPPHLFRDLTPLLLVSAACFPLLLELALQQRYFFAEGVFAVCDFCFHVFQLRVVAGKSAGV